MYLGEAANLGTALLLRIPERKRGTSDLSPFKEMVVSEAPNNTFSPFAVVRKVIWTSLNTYYTHSICPT